MQQNQEITMLQAIKTQKFSDDELIILYRNELHKIKLRPKNPRKYVDEIKDHFLAPDLDGKNIYDYCVMQGRLDLFKSLSHINFKNEEEKKNFFSRALFMSVTHDSHDFLEYLINDQNPNKLEISELELANGGNIFFLVNSNVYRSIHESFYQLSDRRIEDKLTTAKILLQKNPNLLIEPRFSQEASAITPLQCLYRFGSPSYIKKFKNLMSNCGVFFDLDSQEKYDQIFFQLTRYHQKSISVMQEPTQQDRFCSLFKTKKPAQETAKNLGDIILNSDKIDLIKLVKNDDKICELLKNLYVKEGFDFFSKKDANNQSFLELMTKDKVLRKFIGSTLSPDQEDEETVALRKEILMNIEVKTLLEKNREGQSLFLDLMYNGHEESVQIIIDKMSKSEVKTHIKDLEDLFEHDLLLSRRIQTQENQGQVRQIDNQSGAHITSYLVFVNTQNQNEFTETSNVSSEQNNIQRTLSYLNLKKQQIEDEPSNLISTRCFSSLVGAVRGR